MQPGPEAINLLFHMHTAGTAGSKHVNKEFVFEARLIPSGNLSSGHATWPPGYNICLLTSTLHKIYHAHNVKMFLHLLAG